MRVVTRPANWIGVDVGGDQQVTLERSLCERDLDAAGEWRKSLRRTDGERGRWTQSVAAEQRPLYESAPQQRFADPLPKPDAAWASCEEAVTP